MIGTLLGKSGSKFAGKNQENEAQYHFPSPPIRFKFATCDNECWTLTYDVRKAPSRTLGVVLGEITWCQAV